MKTEELIKTWILEAISAHLELMAIAVRQRAKFEGWLKFELAALAEASGYPVEVECSSNEASLSRSDLMFLKDGARWDVELKTCNTNWRMAGVLDLTRPITKNIASIVGDARKLKDAKGNGVVAFCLFPVPIGDDRWTGYLKRIGDDLGIALSPQEHSDRLVVPLGEGSSAEVVVVTFSVAEKKVAA
jgi:hypothetical protein